MVSSFYLINVNILMYNQFILITYLIIIWLIYLIIRPYYINYKFDTNSSSFNIKSFPKSTSRTPNSPKPPKPPKKNWKEKVKEHFSQYKEIYIGSCVLIISLAGIMYYYDLSFYDFLDFFKNKRRPEGGNPLENENPYADRVQFYRGDRPSWPSPSQYIIGTQSLSTYLTSENMHFMFKRAQNLEVGLTRVLVDQIKSGLQNEAKLITESIISTLSQSEMDSSINNNTRSDVFITEPGTSSTRNYNRNLPEFMIAETIAQGYTQDLMSQQLDSYLNNLDTQIMEETERYLSDRISEETNKYLTESILDETNRQLTNAIFKEALDYQEESDLSNDLNANTNFNAIQFNTFLTRLFEKDLTEEEFDQVVSEFRTYDSLSRDQVDYLVSDYIKTSESSSQPIQPLEEILKIEEEIEEIEEGVSEITMSDIRLLHRNRYPYLAYREIIDLLIFDEIGVPTPLKDLIENGELTELGYERLEEEIDLISKKFKNNVLNFLIENLLHRTELTDGIQLNRIIIRYMDTHQLIYRDPNEFDRYIKELHHYLIHEDSLISDYLNSLESEDIQSDESQIIYYHIAATILNEYMQYTGLPSGYQTYHEMANIIKLYLVLQKHFELCDFTTVELLALARGY